MKAKRFLFGALTAAAMTTSVGCGAPKVEHSGFLSDYSKLEPAPKVDGAMIYRKPGMDLGKFDKFIIRPIGVHFTPENEHPTIDADTLKELTDYFRAKLIEELKKNNYQVVTQPGQGVLDLRIAITNLKKTQPLLNIHPAMKLSGLGLGGAAVEAEAFDTGSGERQFAFLHAATGNRLGVVEGLQDWAHAKQAMDYWAQHLVERLNEAHKKAPAK